MLTLWVLLVDDEVFLRLDESLLRHYVQLHILPWQSFNYEASEVEYTVDLNGGFCPADFDPLKMFPSHLHLAFPPLSLGCLIQLPSFIEYCHEDLGREGFATFCCQLKHRHDPIVLSEETKHVGVAP